MSSKRPSKKTERRTTLTAMARATQRSTESPKPSSRPKEAKISFPPSPPFFDVPRHDELPPPYDDASGFIDLDKLREAAMAEASLPSTPAPMTPPAYQSRTAPPVAATLPVPVDEPTRKSSSATGILVGSAIAAAGIAASFFIVSRGIDVRDLGHRSAKQQSMAMKVEGPPLARAAAPSAVAAAPGAAALAGQAKGTLGAVPTPTAATSETETANNDDAPAAGAARDLGDIDSTDKLDPKERALRARRARARRARLRAEKTDGTTATGGDTAPDPAFAQALQKSAESSGAAPAAAAPAAAAPEPEAPAPRAAPPALPAGPPGLAAAIQKASGVEATPAAAAPRARAATDVPPPAAAPPVNGLPDAPSFGAVRAGLASQIGAAKACVRDQTAPSRVSLTFGSDGKVKSIGVTGPAAGTPAEECIRGAFQRSTVAPFSRPTFNVGFSVRPETTSDSDR